jgi:hypothetical protein
MVEIKNKKLSKISLEEKLKKLVESVDEEPNETKTTKDKQFKETKDVKESLSEKILPIFEPVENVAANLQLTEEDKELPKTENLEQAVAEVQTTSTDKKENEPNSINYVSSSASGIGNCQANNQKENINSKYNPGITNTEKNLSRERDRIESPNMMSNKLHNPFGHSRRDSSSYFNNYSSENMTGEKDSARMYEETKQRFYETSQRDVHHRAANKNI